jgi:hypothetical protein
MPSTILSSDDLAKLRAILVMGVQHVMGVWHKSRCSLFQDFDDLELAVSTENLTCSNCEALEPNELGHFVRLTEKFHDSKDERSPRQIMFGVVMILTSNSSCPAACKLWEVYMPRWSGPKEALARITDKDIIHQAGNDLERSVWMACKEQAARDLENSKQTLDEKTEVGTTITEVLDVE